jgi:hypothetical protein
MALLQFDPWSEVKSLFILFQGISLPKQFFEVEISGFFQTQS